jgi:hypothetical protein
VIHYHSSEDGSRANSRKFLDLCMNEITDNRMPSIIDAGIMDELLPRNFRGSNYSFNNNGRLYLGEGFDVEDCSLLGNCSV